ncbi:MAG: acetyl-CoA carboxylase biotin carboxyl carrier protein subunit, partial [Oscillospiraceae bacterium]|nr:acetyl-CoA carboxylase biotin carboxyl carrier protein subunit [Oscillospiraceae bacterium]
PAAAVEGGTPVKAPMPGTINDIKVSVGDTVNEAQVLLVLEAMKMENDIVAPKAGKIAAINVKKGDSVNSNDLLLTIL